MIRNKWTRTDFIIIFKYFLLVCLKSYLSFYNMHFLLHVPLPSVNVIHAIISGYYCHHSCIVTCVMSLTHAHIVDNITIINHPHIISSIVPHCYSLPKLCFSSCILNYESCAHAICIRRIFRKSP